MDHNSFVTVDGSDAIIMLTKSSRLPFYIPTHFTTIAEATARIFFNNVIKYYGVPLSIFRSVSSIFRESFQVLH